MPFTQFGLDAALLRGVKDLGFDQPTPIQRDAIPPALEGRDLLACAMTGSGKTAAFVLPVLHHLLPKRRGTTRALVLTPTRELAAQVEEHARQLARHTRVSSAAVFGGVGMAPQERAFREGADILVATPGRLLDHLQRPYARLDGLQFLVLDEADRMLDMGFLPDIRRVLSYVPAKRQTMLFSATVPPPIAALASTMLRDPVSLNIERRSAPATGITHSTYRVPQTQKSPLLLHLLQSGEMQSVVVFTRTKHRANRLADYLTKQGVSCGRLHGNRSQAQRTAALSGFRDHAFRVLVATDIAARGIDVEALSHVVNFDVPQVPEDYIHRVGRTARAEATGDAVTFVSPEEEADLRDIERALGKKLPIAEARGFSLAQVEVVRPEVTVAERKAEARGTGAAKPATGARKPQAAKAPRQAPAAPAQHHPSLPERQHPAATPQAQRPAGPARPHATAPSAQPPAAPTGQRIGPSSQRPAAPSPQRPAASGHPRPPAPARPRAASTSRPRQASQHRHGLLEQAPARQRGEPVAPPPKRVPGRRAESRSWFEGLPRPSSASG